jgi:hypothetical protein
MTRRLHLLIAASIALPVLAADSLAVKTGLWETATTANSAGIPAIPADTLAKMPPAQRAQMEQIFKQMGANGPSTSTDKSCVTEKDLQAGAFRQSAQEGNKNCKYTAVSSTPKHQEWTFQCPGSEGGGTGRVVVDAASNTQVRGTFEMKSPQVSMNMKFESKWVSASCAGADKD